MKLLKLDKLDYCLPFLSLVFFITGLYHFFLLWEKTLYSSSLNAKEFVVLNSIAFFTVVLSSFILWVYKNYGKGKSLRPYKIYSTVYFVVTVSFLLFRYSIFGNGYVGTSSMEPSLMIGDRLLITSINQMFEYQPRRGDVIGFIQETLKKDEKEIGSYGKRIIGLPGDVIEINDGILIVNDVMITHSKVSEDDNHIYFKEQFDNVEYYIQFHKNNIEHRSPRSGYWVVPQGKLFVLGDNRDNSFDSRYRHHFGFVDIDNVTHRYHQVAMNINEGSISRLGCPIYRADTHIPRDTQCP